MARSLQASRRWPLAMARRFGRHGLRTIPSLPHLVGGVQRDTVREIRRLWRDERMIHRNCAADEFTLTLQSVAAQHRYRRMLPSLIAPAHQTDQTLFVLGSGPSINELAPEHWEYIRSQQSWGFNFWFAHPFVPTMYVAQASSKRLDQLMRDLFLARREDYAGTPFLVRGDAFNERRFHESAFGSALLASDLPAHGIAELYFLSACDQPPRSLVASLVDYGFLDQAENEVILPCPKIGATITLLIALALRCGYREIVLCGIDMNDTAHFYDTPEYRADSPLIDALARTTSSGPETHQHVDTRVRTYTVQQHVAAMAEIASERMGGRVLISSTTSRLASDLDVYRFPEL